MQKYRNTEIQKYSVNLFHPFSLAVICAGIHHISDAVFLSAAEGLADLVGEEDIAVGRFSFQTFFKFGSHLKLSRLYPHLTKVREISIKIAVKVATEAYRYK